jgi:hypothetical protein
MAKSCDTLQSKEKKNGGNTYTDVARDFEGLTDFSNDMPGKQDPKL